MNIGITKKKIIKNACAVTIVLYNYCLKIVRVEQVLYGWLFLLLFL